MKSLTMNKVLLLLFAVSFGLVLTIPTSAENPNIKDIAGKTYTLLSREKSSGKLRWQSCIKPQIIEHKGVTFIYFTEEGKECIKEGKCKTWISSGFSYLDGTPYWIKVTLKDSQGKAIENVEKFYDRENKEVICNVNKKIKEFEFKENLVDKQNIVIFLMNYPFEEKRNLDFYLLTHDPALYKLNLKFRGKEKIRIKDREIECYKLEMLPDLGFFNFFRVFIPKTYFWFETSPPHYFVRYEGLESGIGTPYVVTELIR